MFVLAEQATAVVGLAVVAYKVADMMGSLDKKEAR